MNIRNVIRNSAKGDYTQVIKKHFVSAIIYVLVFALTIYTWKITFTSPLNLFQYILFTSLSLILSYIVIYPVLKLLSRFTIIALLNNFFGLIVAMIMFGGAGYVVIIAPFITFVVIFGVQIAMWEVVYYFFDAIPSLNIIQAYQVLLVTIVVFAYYGRRITTNSYKYFSNPRSKAHTNIGIYIDKAMSVFFFRRRAYEFAILLTILSTLDRLYGSPIISNDFLNNISNISFESLITFVAIDTYYINFVMKKNS